MPPLLLLLLICLSACDRSPPPIAPTPTPDVTPAPPADTPPSLTSPEPLPRHPVPGRLIALGDIHGDIAAMRATLRAARVIDDQDRWVGANTTVVQTGDLLDRGDDEQEIIDTLERLRAEAHAAGGALVLLNGNHEVMNVQGDLRYVTPGGFLDFQDVPNLNTSALPSNVPDIARARLAAFLPGGPYALILSQYDVVAIVGRTIFAHGGVLPQHVHNNIPRLNRDTRAWMRAEGPIPQDLVEQDSPIWTRLYGERVEPKTCAQLQEVLTALDVDRLVVGHTVQPQGPTPACDGKVWRVDVGMARHYGGQPAAIELMPDGSVHIIRAQAPADAQK